MLPTLTPSAACASNPSVYAVLGNPVQHSKSPWIHARFAQLCQQSLRYEPRLIPLEAFAQSLQQLHREGLHGCNVTVPFKFEAFQLARQHTPRAALAQAANVLTKTPEGWSADNSDGVGLVRDIEHNASVRLQGRSILLIGAGGASAGVLGPLLSARPARLVLINRTHERALTLMARHQSLADEHGCVVHTPTMEDLNRSQESFDVIINASASSLQGESVPVSHHVLRPSSLALDMMYGPAAHGFLHWATQHGAQARDGLGMLVEQAGEAFALWRGVRPPCAQVLAELRYHLDHGTPLP